MKIFKKIVQARKEPLKEALWLRDGSLYYYEKGFWKHFYNKSIIFLADGTILAPESTADKIALGSAKTLVTKEYLDSLHITGKDGESSYLHLAYADDAIGNGFSTTDTKDKTYIGTAITLTKDTSHLLPSDYKWLKSKGEKGDSGGTGYRIEKFTTPGYEFFSMGQETYKATLSIHVFYNDIDITDTIPSTRFVWTRISENPLGDPTWNALHSNSTNSINITYTDLAGDTGFICRFLDTDKTLISKINF